MRAPARIALLLLLLPVACREKEPEVSRAEPVLKVVLRDSTSRSATLEVQSFDAAFLCYGANGPLSADALLQEGNRIATAGTGHAVTPITLEGLRPGSPQVLSVMALGSGGETSPVVHLFFHTLRGTDALYGWESRRSGPPAFADVSLITRGQHNPDPPLWTQERFAAHVTGPDGSGTERWLFDAILCTESFDAARGLTFCITPNGRHSATRDSWEDLLTYWFAPDGALHTLDETVRSAALRIGDPPTPRYVIIAVPDPIMLECFADKSSVTDYWGAIDGRQLDFADVEDQIRACLWYIDECRRRFDALAPRYLELAGFYILSEELPLAEDFYRKLGLTATSAETWNAAYKRWETILPETAAYLHSCHEGLYWVPYFLAPGHRVWKQLGIDQAFMQPNHYWDTANQHPMEQSIGAMLNYGLGIELEFEYSLVREVMADGRWGPDGAGNPTFTYQDIPALEARLKEYMSYYRNAGLYGVRPVALYSGTDALHQIAVSADPDDRSMYLALCSFILDSPLKR